MSRDKEKDPLKAEFVSSSIRQGHEVRAARLTFGFAALHNPLRVLKDLMWRKTHSSCQRSKLGHLYLALCAEYTVDGLHVHSCFLC